MLEKHSTVSDTLPLQYGLPVAIIGLLIGTAVALSTGQDILGIIGLLALTITSLTFGALQRPSDFT